MDGGSTHSDGATEHVFIEALGRAKHVREPYDHWLLNSVLPERLCKAIVGLPFPPPAAPTFDGRRESNNSTRVYFDPALQARYPECRDLARSLDSAKVRAAIERTTGRSLTGGRLRIEYCQDQDGFWLEPHVDIPVKLFTMLIYLSAEPELADAGTDIYDDTPEHRPVGRSPCAWNTGLIFIPGKTTWHGFSPRPIRGIRKSLIVNFVGPEWRAAEELA